MNQQSYRLLERYFHIRLLEPASQPSPQEKSRQFFAAMPRASPAAKTQRWFVFRSLTGPVTSQHRHTANKHSRIHRSRAVDLLSNHQATCHAMFLAFDDTKDISNRCRSPCDLS